jgi:hypothetical protein
MYDTIGMFSENNYLNESLFSNSRESYNKETGEITTTGTLENLRIKKSGNNVSIIGSLPKFYFGDNIQQLTRKDSEHAIEKVSDLLKLPMKESAIFRLDIGSNFILNLPLQNYYTCLGELSRFKKSEIANRQSLLYTTTTKTLQFYDKVNEVKRTKQTIPELFNQKYVLRYELQLKKKIPGSLKLPEVKAKHLYQENFYIKGINFWKDFYFLIQRINRLKFNQESLTMVNARTLLYQLAAMQVKAIGEDQLLSMIEANKNQVKHRNQVSRMRELVKSLSNEPEITEPNEAIKELDSKVKRASKYYR